MMRDVTAVGGVENGGSTLAYAHVVRSIARMGEWFGGAQQHSAARPLGERVAVLLQAPDGGILGAATA